MKYNSLSAVLVGYNYHCFKFINNSILVYTVGPANLYQRAAWYCEVQSKP